MELDELKKIWKQQKINPDLEYSESEILMLINNKMIAFDKDIRLRDRIELIACAFVIVAFGVLFFIFSSFWIKLGCAIIIVSALYVGYRLKQAKPQKLNSDSSNDRSVIRHLKIELENVKEQKRLLKNIAWWYIAPICIGLIFFTIGTVWYLMIKIVYISLVILLGVGLWYLNQQAVARRLDPLIAEIQQSLEFLKREQK